MSKGNIQMVLWPAVALVGFLVLTGLVIVMGTSTTARYEREQRAAARASVTSTPATEHVRAPQTAQAAQAA
jgi:hypothetical protein